MTDTPAMRKIPGASELYEQLAARHPAGRPTTAEDVARAVKALSGPDTAWISGEVIGVDAPSTSPRADADFRPS
jgi:NAD(P)-dependent dehydrogenase (short-subunit alcohol dehydrogenase family)